MLQPFNYARESIVDASVVRILNPHGAMNSRYTGRGIPQAYVPEQLIGTNIELSTVTPPLAFDELQDKLEMGYFAYCELYPIKFLPNWSAY